MNVYLRTLAETKNKTVDKKAAEKYNDEYSQKFTCTYKNEHDHGYKRKYNKYRIRVPKTQPQMNIE